MSSARKRRGRRPGGPRFVQLFYYVMDCAAFHALKPAERSVLLEIARRYDGTNNGRIGLSVREAAAHCNINKDTAARCFHRLVALGFIECAQEGGFNYKARHSAEWRMTWQRCDRTGQIPTKAFLKWSPSPSRAKTRSEMDENAVRSEGSDRKVQRRSVPPSQTDLREGA